MKLSKRQLKRIIREEYSRLQRRGLLSEYAFGVMDLSAELNGKGYDAQEIRDMERAFGYVQEVAPELGWEGMDDLQDACGFFRGLKADSVIELCGVLADMSPQMIGQELHNYAVDCMADFGS